MAGEAQRAAAGRWALPKITAPTEQDDIAVRTGCWIARQVNRARNGIGSRNGDEEGGGDGGDGLHEYLLEGPGVGRIGSSRRGE